MQQTPPTNVGGSLIKGGIMPLTISDEMLREAGLSEGEARVEFACRLFEANKLSLWSAAKWAGLTRTEFEEELLNRKVPLYRPGVADLSEELLALQRLDI